MIDPTEAEVTPEPTEEEAERELSPRAALYRSLDKFEMRSALPETRCVRAMDPDGAVVPQVEMREVANGTGGSALTFTGYASIVERGYEMSDMFGAYTEIMARGAFDKTIAEGADVAFLMNHEGLTMARTRAQTLTLRSDATGLHTEARLNPDRSDVQLLRAAVDDGSLNEMSFAFRVVNQEWDEDYTERRILEVNMNQGDVSLVNYGANPHTAGSVSLQARSASMNMLASDILLRAAVVTQALMTPEGFAMANEWRAGGGPTGVKSAAGQATLNHVLSLIQTSDTAVDEALVVLSSFIGVPNPDDAQDASMKPDGSSAPPAQQNSANAKLHIPNYTVGARERLRLLALKGAA